MLLFLFYFQLTANAYASLAVVLAGGAHLKHGAMMLTTTKTSKMAEPAMVASKNQGEPVDNARVYNDPSRLVNVNIGGPGQPEMRSFKSVGTDNMVNEFTGDFSYNIPLLDVGGYPINLFYNAGVVMEQEASWVGLGWNLNPGTISRNKRGMPDDFNGNTSDHDADFITKEQTVKDDITVGASLGVNWEVAGLPGNIEVSPGMNAGVFWNNKRGLGLQVSGNFSFQKKMAKDAKDSKTNFSTSLSIGAGLNSQNGASLNLGADITNKQTADNAKTGLSTSIDYNSRTGLGDLKIDVVTSKDKSYEEGGVSHKSGSLNYATISFARPSYTPSIRMPMTRTNGYLQIKLGGAFTILHGNGVISGSLSTAKIADDDKVQIKRGYGYMYYQDANENPDALLDFNRMNDGVYTLKTPLISIPEYTYDAFTINGEGTGGSFRGYRGNLGFIRDHHSMSKSGSFNLSLDAGTGNLVHAGVDGVGAVYSTTQAGDWEYNNAMRENAKFNQHEGDYEGFYFKNPAEKTIMDEAFFNACGQDKLIRPKLESPNRPFPLLASAFESFGPDRKYLNDVPVSLTGSRRNVRDKRTQIISFLTAEEASRVGLQKQIVSYDENVFKSGNCNHFSLIRRCDPGNKDYQRKSHHISEINVLEADGKRYVYGLPVYNYLQREATFSLHEGQGVLSEQLTSISYNQNTLNNKNGKDHYFERETVNGFAHSFLLTGILSPDYVDITGDGISDDDMGTAIKFNYTRVNKINGNQWETQKWRTPYEANIAHYNPGLRSDNGDDKGLYTYGEKELWYTHSIETKNMIATFIVSDRRDAHGVKGENGGMEDIHKGRQRKLEKINLYTKAEFLKENPRPVKTVHFSYSYQLCGNVPGNDGEGETVNNVNVNEEEGKLTLESVWFSYNGNERQVKNKYRFKYAENKTIITSSGNVNISGNPAYHHSQTDRWGLYKPNAANPAGAINMDFPYTLQGVDNVERNNAYASVWNLEKILLPSGSVISVTYEADDYAYVQDRRAMQMTKIAGFGKNSTEKTSSLYSFDPSKFGNPGEMDYNFVFFDVDQAITSNEDIRIKYLAEMKQVLLKIWVLMPKDFYGEPTYEPINVYGTVKNYGYDPANNKQFWIELNSSSSGGSQLMETVIQFVKDRLPSKVYKGYDAGNQPAIRQIVYAIQGLASSFFQALEGFEFNLKSKNKLRSVDLSRSFARMGNPYYKKQGGGHRVKRITISDNWKKMTDPLNTHPAPVNSYYGQEYDYTTEEDGRVISSGVATYEPGVGGEENPFREILQYKEKQPLGPTNYNNIELPVTETFFPSPMIGYSKITVRSIHNKTNKNIKSGIGKQVTEFYTCREFPVITDYTDFDDRSRKQHKPSALTKILFSHSEDKLTLTQGFRVILNDMNGKLKSKKSYAEGDDVNYVSATTYHYKKTQIGKGKFRPLNIVPCVSGPDGIIANKMIGKDLEVMNDFRAHIASTNSVQIPGNLEGFFVGPWPLILLNMLHMHYSEVSIYRSAVTLKVVHEYGLIDSIVNVDKGSYITTRNLVYDAETGEPLVTSVTNEFKKPVYSFNYPAHWVNSGMSLAYKNIDLTYRNVFFKNGRIHSSPHVDMTKFESGDEIYVVPGNDDAIPIPACVSAGFSAPSLTVSEEYRIWAIDVTKDPNNPDRSFVFLEREGKPYNGNVEYMRVIRSGKRNMVGASVGAVTCLKDPVVVNGAIQKLQIDQHSDVINASAMEFKENWKVADATYKKTVTDWFDRYVLLQDFELGYDTDHSISMTNYGCGNCNDYFYTEPVGTRAVRKVSWLKDRTFGTYHKPREHQSFIRFKLDDLVPGATIKSAKLSLKSHTFSTSQHSLGYFNPHFGSSNMNYNPHNGATPHYSSPGANLNGFIVSKLIGGWPVNDQGFQHQFYNTPYTPGDFVYVPAPPNNVFDYFLSSQGVDSRIDVSPLVQKMADEKSVIGSNYSSGIKLSMAVSYTQAIDQEIRLCFGGPIDNIPGNSISKNSNSNISTNPNTAHFEPSIKGTYYVCADALEYGAPVPTEPYDICRFYETNDLCLSHFDRTSINFYTLGLLGNWKPWRSYVYYGDRKEKDPTLATDLPKNGVIDQFESFWLMAPGYLQKTNSAKWVWNSEITQSNRKGVEIENHDPLGRYNSGI